MQRSSLLHENRPHGTMLFPAAFYLISSTKTRLRVKHHWHEKIEIIYLPTGRYHIEINMEPYEIDRECLLFINSGELHALRSLSEDYEERAVVFDPQMLRFQNYDSIEEHLLQPLTRQTMIFPRYLDASHPVFPALREEYLRIACAFCKNQQIDVTGEEIYTDNMVSQIRIKASLLQILALLEEHDLMLHTAPEQNQRIESIKTVLAYIRQHYQEKLYIADLSALVNMNEQYFCRFFKKAIGKSPIDYINDYRLTKVMRLLEDSEQPVTEISLECGFNNMGNFQRLFKRKTGTTPLQYRKQSLAEHS